MQPLELRALEAQEHVNDLLREAEDERCWYEMKRAAHRQPPYAPLLVRLGSMLVELGADLRARYGGLNEYDDEVQVGFTIDPRIARRM